MNTDRKTGKLKWISWSTCVRCVFFMFLVSAAGVSAAPPNSPYVPGETLNPSCAVLDTNCTVTQIYVATTTLNYGIGTTSPFARFSLAGTSTAQTALFAISTSTASATSTALIVDGNGRVGIGMAVPLSDFSVAGQSYFGRNVGLGTTSPGKILSVHGDAIISGTLSVGNFIATSTSIIFSGLGTDMLTAVNSSGNLVSTSTPTASHYLATSTTATSTFAGGVSLTGTGTGLNIGTLTRIYQNGQTLLTSSSTAAGNLAVGYQAAPNVDGQGGLYSTYLGYQAGNTATSSSYNTGIGYQALKSVVKGSGDGGLYNTGVGYQSLTSNTTGPSNSAVGYDSLYSNTTGNDNSALGVQSLYSNTTGHESSALGSYSLYSNTTGYENSAMGVSSLDRNTTGFHNSAVGHSSLYSNTTGANNSALGSYSLWYNTSATSTVAVGFEAAQGVANYNNQGGVYVGYQAGELAATGSNYNTFLGYQTGYNLTTGSYNIALGQNVDVPSGTGSQQLNIGNLLYGTGVYNGSTVSSVPVDTALFGIGTTTPGARLSVSHGSLETTPAFLVSTSTASATTTAFIIDANGKVGIGTSSPGFALGVVGTVGLQGLTSNAAGNAVCILASNEITTAGAATCSGVSSQRFKHDIASSTLGLDTVLPMRPVSFRYNDGYGDNGKVEQFGLIAEEVYNIDPRLVILDAEGLPVTVRYDFLAPILIKSVQDLNLKLDELASTTHGANVLGELSGTALGGIWSSIISKLSDAGVYISQAFSRITNLFAGTLHIEEKLCADDVCVTKDQLKTLLRQAGADAGGAEQNSDADSADTDAVDTEPPIIIPNGNNPATVEKGATYIDLGAIVTDNVDHNLGVQVIGEQIDTTVSGEHTVTYSATDQALNTATTTRTVIVSDPNEAGDISTTTPSIISPSSEDAATSTAGADTNVAF